LEIQQGSLYPALYYRLTATGRRELQEETRKWNQMADSSDSRLCTLYQFQVDILPKCAQFSGDMSTRRGGMGRTRTGALLLGLAALAWSQVAHGQGAGALGPEVRKYLRVSTPRVVLAHVSVIDGTGEAPRPDQNVYIDGGKITAISAGADQLPSDGTTFLNLRGYSVMPGLVGMHDHLFYLARPNLRADNSFDGPSLFLQMSFSAPRLYLANGVTTARTAGSVYLASPMQAITTDRWSSTCG
jgi:hypothetical protein